MQVCVQCNSRKPKSTEILRSVRSVFKSKKPNPENVDGDISLFSRVYIRCFCHFFLFANNFALSNSGNGSRKITGIGKKLLVYVLLLLCFSNISKAQITTEFFEDETDGSKTFTNNSEVFDLTSNFHITDYPGEGYGPSDKFIDNFNDCLPAAGIIGSIKPHASGYVKVSSLWLFSSADCATVSNNGTATITGKKSGVTQYTISLTSVDLNNSQSVNNGFKLITFSSYASADTKDVDELEFAVGGTLRYLAIDNFTYTYVPLTDASAVIFSNTLSTSTDISWTNGTGTSRAVFVKAASSGFPAPVDNSTYTANTVFASGTQIGGTGWYCVYNGTGTGVTVTGLTANTAYRTMVAESNGSLGSQKYSVGTTAVNNPNNVTTSGAALLSASVNTHVNVSCNSGSNGSATVTASGGTSPYSYSWSPSGGTGASATGLIARAYTVTVTDATSASTTANVTITQPPAIVFTPASQTNVACFGGSTGAAAVNAATGGTGIFTYDWTPGTPTGDGTTSITGLTAGVWIAVATDANGCTATRSFTLTQLPAINTATGSQTNVSCFGGSNGAASVTPSGGTPSYTYSWSPSGGTAATATGLAAGSYTVTVTDANGCTATRSYTITQPPAVIFTLASQTNVGCFGGSNGAAAVNVATGGTGIFTYDWTPGTPTGDGTTSITGLTAGVWIAVATDANGCTATLSFTITQPSVISTATGSQTNVSCNGGTNGSASVSPSGGTPGYTYSWSPSGGTAATATGLAAGNYTVTITDANGCTATSNYTITEPLIITATTSQTNVSCNGSSTGSASVVASGGSGGYSYSWSPSGGTAATASDLAAGAYTCTITDANTCSITKDFTITESPAITATTSQTNVICTGGSTGTATVVASGGTGTKTYSWSPLGGTDATAIDLAAGDYTCTITDQNLCSIIKTFSITEPASTPGSNSYLLPTSNQTVTRTAGTSNFVNTTCELVSTVLASGSSPVSGMVTSKVWIEGTVPTDNGYPFVQRHYEITPATNAPDATGTITLYFTQTEFDNFNAHAGSTLNLPANASDDAGKANLRIGKYSGISGDGTGLPSSYSSSAKVIDPDDNDILWNAVSGSWEVTFAVDGFSGFVVQTSAFVLPVTWVSFTAKKQGQSVVLNWSTATEQNTKDFSIQHSIDGIKWNTAAILAAAGNTGGLHTYSYVDNNTVQGYNYYRIMQTDLDGKISYSEMRVVELSGDYVPFTILGNPVGNGVLRVQVHQITVLSIYEVNGKLLWVKQFTPGLQSIDVSRYAKGIYLLKTNGKTQKIFIE